MRANHTLHPTESDPMLLITRRVATGLLLVPFAGIRLAGSAPAAATRVTFILVNDIYLMADTVMPDGVRRGGFARLAAVVKAERAKAAAAGGHAIFAHGGDTLSPSLMSGIDHGAHIITLTNLVPPDIFAPGNHEFDFGKETFLQRMGEAAFPLYAANLRDADGKPLPNFKDRSIVTVGSVRIGLTGAAFDDSERASDPGDLKFASSVATMKAQADALRREGADFVVVVAHVTREQGYEIFAQPRGRSHSHRPHPRSVHQLRRPHRHGGVELRRPLRHRDRHRHRRQGGGRAPYGDVVAAIPRHRHRDGDARPRCRGGGRASSRAS